MDKIKEKILQFKTAIKPRLILADEKFAKIITDSKLRKIMYIFVGSFLGIMFLIIVVGIIALPFRKSNLDSNSNGFILNKPNIIVASPIPQKELNETQKKLLNLENRINELKFPESILNIPVVQSGLNI